jgi:hypothetical protein
MRYKTGIESLFCSVDHFSICIMNDEVMESMLDLLKKLRKEENGQSLVMITLLFMVLLSFSALVIDIGVLYVTKAELQNAADAGALAGASVPLADTINEAKEYARVNGVNDSVPGTTITVDPNVVVNTVPVTTTGNAYSQSELDEMKADLITELGEESDETLIEMANENAVTSGLSTNNQKKYTADQINAIGTKSDLEVIDLAKSEGIYSQIENYVKKNGNGANVEFQNKNDRDAAVLKVQSELEKIVVSSSTIISNKTLLIETIASKIMADIGNEVLEVYEKQTSSDKVKVAVTTKVTYTFARFLGLTESSVSAYAVAERGSWDGAALPFINLDGDAENSVKGQTLSAWNKVGPGDKERISNDDLLVSSDNTSIKVNYEDGFLTFKKGKVMSKISNALDKMLVVGKTVYLYSLKESEMSNYEKKGPKELKNGDLIPLSDIVLLECKVTEWDGKLVSLEFENSYYYDSVSKSFLSNTGTSPSASPKLVE